MSWHYSLALEAEYLEANCLDGEPFARWKSIPIAPDDSCSDKMKDTFHHSPFGMMFVPLTDALGVDVLMWFLEGFHAKTFQYQDQATELRACEADFGNNKPESSGKYDPVSRSWKTRQCSLFEDLAESWEIFPKWGTMHRGEFWEQTPLDLTIIEPEFGWLPTPRASMATHGICWARAHSKAKGNLEDVLAQKLVKTGVTRIRGLSVSASFVTLLMGWPQKWASLNPLETDKFQSWLQMHSEYLVETPFENE